MRSHRWRVLSLFFVVILVTCAATGCSGAGSLCHVSYDAEGSNLHITITPRGESGDRTIVDQRGYFRRETKITDGEVTQITEPINLKVTYAQSGNAYNVTGRVTLKVNKSKVTLDGYDLVVSGGMLDTPQICKK